MYILSLVVPGVLFVHVCSSIYPLELVVFIVCAMCCFSLDKDSREHFSHKNRALGSAMYCKWRHRYDTADQCFHVPSFIIDL